MPSGTPISLAVEDELSEHLLRVLIAQTNRDYLVCAVYGKQGAGYLKRMLHAFNNAASLARTWKAVGSFQPVIRSTR